MSAGVALAVSSIVNTLQSHDALLTSHLEASESCAVELRRVREALFATKADLDRAMSQNAALQHHINELQTSSASAAATEGALSTVIADASSQCDPAVVVTAPSAEPPEELLSTLRRDNKKLSSEVKRLRRELAEAESSHANAQVAWSVENSASAEVIKKLQATLAERDTEANLLTTQLEEADHALRTLKTGPDVTQIPAPVPRVMRHIGCSISPLVRDVGCHASLNMTDVGCSAQLIPDTSLVSTPRHRDCVSRADHEARLNELRMSLEKHEPLTIGVEMRGPNGESVEDYERIIAELKERLAVTFGHMESMAQRNRSLVESKSLSLLHAMAASHRNAPSAAASTRVPTADTPPHVERRHNGKVPRGVPALSLGRLGPSSSKAGPSALVRH